MNENANIIKISAFEAQECVKCTYKL